jgi:predicted DCC family thiol-disulfide oxidoreductase YuxK
VFTEITDIPDNAPAGWLLYDGDCPLCIAGAKRFARILNRRGFKLAPLQEPWVENRLGLAPEVLLNEMRLLLPDGRILGGADVVIYLAGRIWWAWPFYLLARVPGVKGVLQKIYRWIAAHRYCASGTCRTGNEVRP